MRMPGPQPRLSDLQALGVRPRHLHFKLGLWGSPVLTKARGSPNSPERCTVVLAEPGRLCPQDPRLGVF